MENPGPNASVDLIARFSQRSNLRNRRPRPMMESSSLVERAMERILEMSADLQIERMATTKYSLAFHDSSVAIAAYGKVLEMLVGLQRQEECSPNLGLLGAFATPPGSRTRLF